MTNARTGRAARTATLLAALLCGIAAHAAGDDGKSAQVEWKGIERVVAFADVHGAYDELVALLSSQGTRAGRLAGRMAYLGGAGRMLGIGGRGDGGSGVRAGLRA